MRRAPHPTAALQRGRAAHVLPSGGLPIVKFSTQGGAAAQPRAARSSIGAKRAV